jgi:hypothetical protein
MNFKEWFKINEEKDACYHKVKSRYNVWPSAYASGSLVKCRKVGAKNWGNSKKKKHMQKENLQIDETLVNKKQYDDAAGAAMALMYQGHDVKSMNGKEIIETLKKMGKEIPSDVSPIIFAARIKSASLESVGPKDFERNSYDENTFKLEKERGLKGWFDRNNGKGWIDCKKSTKGNLVPCGRKTAGKGTDREYPACRPTLSACNTKGKKRKKSSKRISWQ